MLNSDSQKSGSQSVQVVHFSSAFYSAARVNNDEPASPLYPHILGFKSLPGSPRFVTVPGFTG